VSYSEPTVFENYVHDIFVDEQMVELSLWDTAGMGQIASATWFLQPELSDLNNL
jgi:GTPase SAR1 family protein